MFRPILTDSSTLKLRRVALYVFLGIFLGFSVFTFQFAPRAFHEEWLKRGSAYDVEREYFYAGLYGRAQEMLGSAGLSRDSLMQKYLHNKQKVITESAIDKMAEDDGERIIWNLKLDHDFWDQLESKQNVPEVMPRVLVYYDAIISKKIASRWANIEGFVRANQLANYFFQNFDEADMSPEKKVYWHRYIVTTMNRWADELDPAILIQEPSEASQALPLSWNDVLFTGAGMRIANFKTGKWLSCDGEALNILNRTNERLKNLLVFYKHHEDRAYTKHWAQTTSMHLKEFASFANDIQERCPK